MTSVHERILDSAFMQNPHEVYRQLRVEGPVHRVLMPRGLRAWLVTRYADARAALSDPTLSKDAAGAHELFAKHSDNPGNGPVFTSAIVAHMLNTDPPDHTRLRKLVNKAFTTRGIEHLRPRIEQITDELLDAAAAQPGDTVDLLEALAFPLPITVISELLGVPEKDRDDFRRWSNILVSSVDKDVHEAAVSMAEFLTGLVAGKRDNPGEDILSALVTARDAEDKLSEQELVSMAFLLLVAGHETTVNLIGNGSLALLRNSGQIEALRGDPGLLSGAVEEFLRFDGPINLATLRYTTEPVEIGGVPIPAGEFVMVSLVAANRDGDRFAQPDALDVTRPPGGHLAFGHGIHYCVGAPLARMEGEIAFGKLLAKFPAIRLAAEPATLRWRESTLMHGLEELPVHLR
jgi:cytochrome P450